MGKTDGITRSRSKVETYRGFSIIRVVAIHHWYNEYNRCYEMSRQFEIKREVYYEFCNEGDENRPSQAYDCKAKKEEIKGCIDKFIEDDSIYFTYAEREKYVYQPNRKNDYGFGYNDLMKLMREHQKSRKRIQILLEDRLTDANFHSECGFLCTGDYEGFKKFVAEQFQFREKFEVYTSTKCKRLKDPQALRDLIEQAINETFEKYGIKDTSAKVEFIEDW